jgi:hypothetical protein
VALSRILFGEIIVDVYLAIATREKISKGAPSVFTFEKAPDLG